MPILNFRSLVWKFAAIYFVLAVAALILTRTALLVGEFVHFRDQAEQGWLTAETDRAAHELAEDFSAASPPDALLRRHLDLLFASPGIGSASEFLSEVAQPLSAMIVGVDAHERVHIPADGDWTISPPQTGDPEWRARLADVDAGENDRQIRERAAAPIQGSNGQVLGYLVVEMRLPAHWWQVVAANSSELPVLMEFMLIFTLCSGALLARYLHGRLRRIESAAALWSTGDLSERIHDTSRDEVGDVARRLNGMVDLLRTLIVARAEAAGQHERRRLARDLHDTVKQRALALNLQLVAALRRKDDRDPGLLDLLNEARGLTDEIQQELALLTESQVGALSPDSFIGEIRARAEAWARRGGFHLNMDQCDAARIPAEHFRSLLRIVDEALANIVRHSDARDVEISLGMTDIAECALTISDNGRGADAWQEGMGIPNMRARAHELPAGRIALASRVGAGTAITVVSWSPAPAAP